MNCMAYEQGAISCYFRTSAPGVSDLYSKPRSCGGRHTITRNKLQGQIVQPGKNQSLK